MNEESLESKLTPAAREALQELSEDFKLQLLRGAAANASKLSSNIDEISVRDIIDTYGAYRPQTALLKFRVQTTFLAASTLLGVIVSTLVIYLLISNVGFRNSPILVTIALGVLLT